MNGADAIIVGGGPAGSTCAWKLRDAGMDVLVLDRAAFPRNKLCAGWVTPEAMRDLELDPRDYPLGLMTFDRLRIHWSMLTKNISSPQHSIRRVEFDDFLLRRSGARLLQHAVRDIRRDDEGFVIDGEFRCRYLVGAGGTACPVYRALFRRRHERASGLQTATYEQEFAYEWQDAACHLWFFDDGLPGYAWYVPKANGHVNVGLGAIAAQLRQRNGHLQDHWIGFIDKLRNTGLVNYEDYDPSGYSYFLRGNGGLVSDDNAYIVGDAAGLATRDMCEGIGPAIRSGLLAADQILGRGTYSIDAIGRYSGGGWASRLLERRFAAAS